MDLATIKAKDARTLWRFSGCEDVYGGPYPGRTTAVAQAIRMMSRSGRTDLSSLFVLPGRVTIGGRPLRRLRLVLPLAPVPAVRRSHPECRRLLPQAGHGAVAPSRGSPLRVLHMCPVMPGDPPM